MLLTLSASSFRASLHAAAGSAKERAGTPAKGMKLTELPRFAREQLGLHGLNISTDFLVGADLARLDQLRDSADKASCPYLVLIESESQPFCHADEDIAEAAIERTVRVAKAANRLGCSAVAVSVAPTGWGGSDEKGVLDVCAARLKRALHAADRLEVNILLSPTDGLTATPERLTDLLKKVGGFRIGTFPDFQAASKAPDPIQYLRRLTPYAAGVCASIVTLKSSKKPPGAVHEPYDLAAYAETVAAVGYTGTLAIDYRGGGDQSAAAEAIVRARAILEAAIGTETIEE